MEIFFEILKVINFQEEKTVFCVCQGTTWLGWISSSHHSRSPGLVYVVKRSATARTLSLEGAEVLPERVHRTPELQQSEVAEFLHLVLPALPPHGHYDLMAAERNRRLSRHSCCPPAFGLPDEWVCVCVHADVSDLGFQCVDRQLVQRDGETKNDPVLQHQSRLQEDEQRTGRWSPCLSQTWWSCPD